MQPQVENLVHEQENEITDNKYDAAQQKEKSSLVSRNVTIGSHRTSIRLEPEMWVGLRDLCRREHVTLHDIATLVADRKASNTSLTAAIRVFIMAYFRTASTEEGHNRAGHGPGGSFMVSLVTNSIGEREGMPGERPAIRSMRMVSLR